jgi:transcriptional regulator with XRE-family HTH domain
MMTLLIWKVGDDMQIGDRIKSLREQRGWTQLELADKVGINNSVLSRIEGNKRPVEDDLVNKFADIFEVTADYLLGRTSIASGGRAYYGGGKDWTEEEKAAADAFIEMLRARKKAEQEKK